MGLTQNRSRTSGARNAWLLAAFALVVALRLPNAWQGRFFGEEGTYFFAHAWHAGAWESFWRPLGGYINVVASGSATMARVLVTNGVLPLEMAPFVTMGVAFLFQLVPAIVIVSSRGEWLERRWVKPVALLMIATTPFTVEVWLHSLHSQFHLALAAAIMLTCAPPARGWARAWRLGVLFLGPLTGPAAIVLAPFFVLRALIERQRGRWMQAVAIVLASAIQIVVFYTPSGVRGAGLSLDELAAIFVVRHALQPFASPTMALFAGDEARLALAAPGLSWALIGIAAALFVPLGVVVLKRWREPVFWLIAPGMALALLSYWGGIATAFELLKPGSGMRYTFVPQVLLCLGLLYLASSDSGLTGKIARVLCLLNLLIGVAFFTIAGDNISKGANWQGEVALWRRDPQHALKIWPADWTVDLAPGNRRCGDTPEPPWCDGAWEAMEHRSINEMKRTSIEDINRKR